MIRIADCSPKLWLQAYACLPGDQNSTLGIKYSSVIFNLHRPGIRMGLSGIARCKP